MLPAGLAAFLLAVVALRFAEPIVDGDIFWHMAYGGQMLARRSLRVDHAMFSWTPTSDALIYCAWIGEILFRLVWDVAGLAGLFALRYLALLGMVGLLGLHGRRLGMLYRPETFLVLLVVLLGSVVGTLPKPEMLSLVLWNGLVFCWFGLLRSRERGGRVLRWIYALPAIVLVWVNTHGAFILAAPLLTIVVVWGVWMLPPSAKWHVAGSGLLCLAATAANPYGVRYPLQVVREISGGLDRPDIAWNNAFQPTLGAAGWALHLPQLLIVLGVTLAGLAWMARRRRWALLPVLAPFIAYVPLDLLYVRATFLLPPLFGYAALLLMRDIRLPRASAVLAGTVFAVGGAWSVAEAALYPQPGSWMGFGIGNSQPVAEAAYLAQHGLGPRILNTYNAGGYLIWRLYPHDQVMVDARSFPYLPWFDELQRFTTTRDPAVFRAFLDRHESDVALVDFQEETVWRSLLRQPGWRPVFYGANGAVFVPSANAPTTVEAAPGLSALRNGRDGRPIFEFAVSVGDYRTAWTVLDQLEGPLRRQVDAGDLMRMQRYRDGHLAISVGETERAWDDFAAAFALRPPEGRDLVILRLLGALRQAGPADPRAATIRAGLSALAAPE